jgi:hypothetical protein
MPSDFSIETFKSNITQSGVTKANRYELRILAPPAAPGIGMDGRLRDIVARVDSVELPGKSLATTEVKYYGPPRKSPYGMTYEDLNFSIVLSSNLLEKEVFGAWMDYIFSYDDATLQYYKNYSTTIEFIAYGERDPSTPLYKVVFEEAFPLSIGSVQFAYGNDEFARLPVTFAYRKWGREELNAESKNNTPYPLPSGNESRTGNKQLEAVARTIRNSIEGQIDRKISQKQNQILKPARSSVMNKLGDIGNIIKF